MIRPFSLKKRNPKAASHRRWLVSLGKENYRNNIIKKERRPEGGKPWFSSSKGAIPIDYVIAAGAFLFAFAFVVQYSIDYFDNVREISDILALRSEATELLGIVDREFNPPDWPELPKTDSLALLMHLNNDTIDYSGNGNNGTQNGGVNCSSAVSGYFFSACSFDGIDDYVNVADSDSLDAGKITVSLWVYVNNYSSSYPRIFDKEGAYELIMYTFSGSEGRLEWDTRIPDETDTATVFADRLLLNRWYHIGVTYDSSVSKIYINGVEKASTTASGSITATLNALLIGNGAGLGTPFNGTIDEVAIYNRSLSASEIEDHFHRGLKRIGLKSNAYRFIIVVNNSASFYRNSSESVRNLNNESVLLNFSSIHPSAEIDSVTIYNESNAIVDHYVHGMNVSFIANISINETRIFTVYFSEGSTFPSRSKSLIIGNNNTINETVFYLEKIPILQYNKLVHLNQSNYTRVVNSSDIENDFNILLEDADTNVTFMQFGKDIPKRGNVVALRRFALFQNGTAAVRNGRLTIRVW